MTEKENILAYLRHEPYAHVPSFEDLTFMMSSEHVAVLDIPVCERPMSGSGYDVFGVHWSDTGHVSHRTPDHPPVYDDIETWREQVRIPNIEEFDWDQMTADAASIDRESKVVAVTLFNGPFERTTMLTSFEDCLMNIFLDPEHFSELIGAIADYKIALIRKISALARPDVYNIHDDWGTMRATFMKTER